MPVAHGKMIDAQHVCSPPLGLEYTIPLPPSPAVIPTTCVPSLSENQAACCSLSDPVSTPAAPAMRTRCDPDPKPQQPPSVGESSVDRCSEAILSQPCATSTVHGSSTISTLDINPPATLEPTVSFEEFASQYRRRQQAEAQKRDLEQRLFSTKASICLSSRLIRTSATIQKGLVEAFRHGDKSSFISVYNTISDVHEACEASARRTLLPHGSSDDATAPLQPQRNRPSGFMHQLSPQCRKDLLELLTLVRTDSQFLVDRITSLSATQLSALTSTAVCTGHDDLFASLSSRSRNSPSFVKRSGPNFALFRDHALAFERSDPLAALLFNVYAVPLDWDLGESHLRREVWSSTCAKLLRTGDSRYNSLVGHIFSYWSLGSDWQARPKVELYLMDVLQKGAFLLENIDGPVVNPYGVEPPDPLRTDAAEEFFEAAVHTLFEVLDDSDAGLPSAALEFGDAILSKLPETESKDRFLEYLYVQWFFAKHLYSALTFPESHGLLLDFHLSKEAREKLLAQIALRAQSQIYRVLHSVPQFSTVHPRVRYHVENILKTFVLASHSVPGLDSPTSGAPFQIESDIAGHSRFLMLSAMDVVTLLNAVFPKTTQSHSNAFLFNSPYTALNISHNSSPRRGTLPAHWSGRIDTVLEQSTPSPVVQQSPQLAPYSRSADLIRFELSDLGEADDRLILDYPSTDEWTVLTLSEDSKSLSWDPSSTANNDNSIFDGVSEDGHRSVTIHSEENHEALQIAIVKLVNESEKMKQSIRGRVSGLRQSSSLSLKSRFDNARSACETRSDFLGAHYWWTASNHLSRSLAKLSKTPPNDSWVLLPMLRASSDLFSKWTTVIENCDESLLTLTPIVAQLKDNAKDNLARMTKLRDKMWYMTDVKNSMRYEDAKHVALALKTMVYSSLQREPPSDVRSRHGSRYLPGAFLQKPEMHVMNVMKASSSQGGPNKLSDEQVELTRKWIGHHGIDNFCRGEERIHRFCYEVKSSINKLVGDTMAETPVLWASELFQKERARFEGPNSRSFAGMATSPGGRPSSNGSDGLLFTSFPSLSSRTTESLRSQDGSPFTQKLSYQTLSSEKWKGPKSVEVDTISSLGGSSTKAASTSTNDSYSTFWSPMQTQAQSAASASSFHSRPPSMFSEAPTPRRAEHVVHGKAAFLDDLRKTLTSLLLSDLGSPVWSCGSETDAWFMNYLNQQRVQIQMNKEARLQKFITESEDRMRQRIGRPVSGRHSVLHRRSQSADPILVKDRTPHGPSADSDTQSPRAESPGSSFAYKAAFSQLLDVFSRNANPYVKLESLRDFRALVVASLNSASELQAMPDRKSSGRDANAAERVKLNRHSFAADLTQEDILRTPTSPVPDSVELESQSPYELLSTSESQIIKTMKQLLKELQPKTLFRDLQFVSAFVPSETLNKTDSGTAFLQFGLAALSLKDDVCASMVELADRIVSQELNRRHSQTVDMLPRSQDPIEDAARMWIITAKEGNAVAQRELGILYLTHPEILPRVTYPLTLPRDTFKAEMMYRRDRDSKSDPQSMCLALHWMQLSASGGDELARNRLREREEFESLV